MHCCLKYLNIMNKDNITPFVATHPGEMIKDELRETVSVTIPVNDRNLLKEIARKFGWACML